MSLARKKLGDAELIIAVFDGSEPLTDTDRRLLDEIKDKRHIVVINKSDLPQNINFEYSNDKNILYVSANTGDGLEKITEKVNELFELGSVSDGTHIFANERQRSLCQSACHYLELALEAVRLGQTPDAVTIYIDEAADALLSLSGEKVTEAVVDDVFSRFCVGK